METFFSWVVIIGVWVAFGWIRAALRNANTPTAFPATGADGLRLQQRSRPTVFTTRLEHGRIDDDPEAPAEIRIMAMGPFPLRENVNAAFVTSVFDKTDGDFALMLAHVEVLQEPGSRCYQRRINAGLLRAGFGFTDWVPVGAVIPEVLQPPRSGHRTLVAVVRLIDTSNPPEIEYGYSDGTHPGLIWTNSLEFSHDFKEKGYKELAEHRREAELLLAKLGVGMALSDGAIDDAENRVLKAWASRTIAHLEGDERERRRDEFNAASREAYRAARTGGVDIDAVLQRLGVIADTATKYEAIELCFEIMAADGVAHPSELAKIDQVIRTLGLDPDEVRKLRDQKLTGLDISSSAHAPVEDLLGIDPSWSEEEVRKHLRAEFRKWNNRLSTLAPGTERDNAQRIIDQIAEARKKHG